MNYANSSLSKITKIVFGEKLIPVGTCESLILSSSLPAVLERSIVDFLVQQIVFYVENMLIIWM